MTSPRRRPASAGLALAGLALAGLAACGGRSAATVHSPAPTTSVSTSATPTLTPTVTPTVTPTATGSPLPPGFAAVSVTAIDDVHAWVLGSVPCGAHTCVAVGATSDGGRTFTEVPSPAAALGVAVPGDASGPPPAPTMTTVTDVRFSNPADGWAYGGALFSTTDGGQHWTPIAMPGLVVRVETAKDRVWALIRTAPDTYELRETRVGFDDWHVVTLPVAIRGAAPDLVLQGSTVWLTTLVPGTGSRIVTSDNLGATWKLIADPCSADLGGELSFGPHAVWAACPTGTQGQVLYTGDRAAPFGATALTELPNTVLVGAVDDHDAVVAAGGTLFRTADDGATFTAVHGSGSPSAGAWRFLGFTDASVGYAVQAGPTATLWRTADGGRTWTAIAFG